MNYTLTEPSPGDRITATWARQLVRELRSQRLLQSNDFLIYRRPNGTTLKLNAKPAAHRKKDLGRFAIAMRPTSNSDPTLVKKLVNCYFSVGGKIYKLDDQPFPEIGENGGFVALQVAATRRDETSDPAAGIVTYDDFPALKKAQADDIQFNTVPLYELDADERVVCDFRIGPDAIMGEF